MIYRIRPSEKEHPIREKKPYRRAGADSVRRLYGYRADAIDIESLFELAKLTGTVKKKSGIGEKAKKVFCTVRKYSKRAVDKTGRILKRFYPILSAVVGYAKKGAEYLCRAAMRKIEKIRSKKRGPSNIYILAGAFCGVLLVAVFSAYSVLYELFLRDYFGNYEKITVPDMVGKHYETAINTVDEKYYNVTVNYEYSTSEPEGKIISQSPAGGAQRKIYSASSPCELSVTVSRGKEMKEMKNYFNFTHRDAELDLRNASFSVIVIEEFSQVVAQGRVISTTPDAGELLEVGGLAVLRVSAGKKIELLRVPDLRGLSENEAIGRIRSSGFAVGNVDYKSSSQKAGTVIEQQIRPKTELEKGSEISFTVSAGQAFSEKVMPSLYGMTVAEAREKLAEYGLVCGNIYTAQSNEKQGLVIAQSIPAGSVISGTSVTVDLYVSI